VSGDPTQDFPLKRSLEVREREVAAEDEVEGARRHGEAHVLLEELDAFPVFRL
jgi:hypothetical protein